MSLISASELKQWLDGDEDFLLFDCRFDLVNPEVGYQSYLEGHIPKAIFVDTDHDLASQRMVKMADTLYPRSNSGKKHMRN